MDPRELRELIAEAAERNLKEWLLFSRVQAIGSAILVAVNGWMMFKDQGSLWCLFWLFMFIVYVYSLKTAVRGWKQSLASLDQLAEDRRTWEERGK